MAFDPADIAPVATTTIFDTPVVRPILRALSSALLRMFGWRLEGQPPTSPRYVLIAAPHTSNWDLVLMLAMAFTYPLKPYWMGKHTLFRWPFGPVMKWLGGLPIDRRSAHNVVEHIAAQFAAADGLVLAVAPEGTRRWTPSWKTGFYHIALEADVPVSLGFVDYQRKAGGFGPTLRPSGDIQADMVRIREFYTGVTAKHPNRASPPQID